MRVTLRLACCGLFLFCRLSYSGPSDDEIGARIRSLAMKVHVTSEYLRTAPPLEEYVRAARASVIELEKDIHAFCALVLQNYPELTESILAIPVVDQRGLIQSIEHLQGLLALFLHHLPTESVPIFQIWLDLEKLHKVVPHISPNRPDFAVCTNRVESAYQQLQNLKKTLVQRYPEVAPVLESHLTQLQWLTNECDHHKNVFYAIESLVEDLRQKRRVLELRAHLAAQQPAAVESHPPDELWLEHRRDLPLTPAPKKSTFEAVMQWLAGWKA